MTENKLDHLVGETMQTAKILGEKASEMAKETMGLGKQKLEDFQLSLQLEKMYTQLGKAVYRQASGDAEATAQVEQLLEKLAELAPASKEAPPQDQ